MVKQTPEEIRQLVLEEDRKKDVAFTPAALIAVVSGVSAATAIGAIVVVRALDYFRRDIDAHWLTCVPFLFPAITGMYVGYKKQFGSLGVHTAVSVMALLLGGLAFSSSVETIFINRENCQSVYDKVSCNKESLAYLYIIFGSATVGTSLLGLGLTLCTCHCALSRISKREHEEAVRLRHEQELKQREERKLRDEYSCWKFITEHPLTGTQPKQPTTLNGTLAYQIARLQSQAQSLANTPDVKRRDQNKSSSSIISVGRATPSDTGDESASTRL
ncbi:uncharacterized protein LOC112566751 isoform X1 [Pomacea canaliculata]|uniref:uncharacterized protein LOC112566751 isoform X1 n=1 Tax=Pomacea canaliculata TaxID=400727 RepID=UPI000D72A95F|nr:uncharacterized protein LOC112566751 isoform X1 [Pomacea canaliculata]